jgi:uncharacterized membrane protein SpoIIM required for sporulation/ABC-type transport system involved in multi-copper enzyme maturation permease subunit
MTADTDRLALWRGLGGARRSAAAALIVTRRELRDQMRDWRIVAPIIILTLVFPLLMNITASQAVNFVARYGAYIIADRLIPFLLMVVGFFPISVSLVIALESFVGEKERHSLEPLLCSPLSDTELYVGKVLAAMLPPLLAAYLGIGVYLAGLALSIGWRPDPWLLFQVLALTTIQALVMVAGAVVISAQTTSVRAANLLASFVIIPMALLVQAESLIMFWGQYHVLWWVILGLALLTVALVRMGVSLFNREELLGREIDDVNLKAMWRRFSDAFIGRGRGGGLPGWYAAEVFPTARCLALPLAIMAVLLLAATLVGASQASLYPLPLDLFAQIDLASAFSANLEQVGLATPRGAAWILFTNLRAVALASAAGALSLGVLGVVLLMAPLALVGYFAAVGAQSGFISPLHFFAAFVLPHGLFEITAALFQGAAILRLGGSVLAPRAWRPPGGGWLSALADWAKITLAIVLPLLLLAALVEAFLTPRVALAILGG